MYSSNGCPETRTIVWLFLNQGGAHKKTNKTHIPIHHSLLHSNERNVVLAFSNERTTCFSVSDSSGLTYSHTCHGQLPLIVSVTQRSKVGGAEILVNIGHINSGIGRYAERYAYGISLFLRVVIRFFARLRSTDLSFGTRVLHPSEWREFQRIDWGKNWISGLKVSSSLDRSKKIEWKKRKGWRWDDFFLRNV